MVTEATSPEFLAKLEARGVSRRSFMKLCGSLAVAAGLTAVSYTHLTQQAFEGVCCFVAVGASGA